MFSKKKGEYGYITKSKRFDIIKMLLYIFVAVAVFVAGLFVNDMSYQNIFTIIAILFVLPWARVLVEFIVFFPYKSPSQEDYSRVKQVASKEATVASDVVITSSEKSMGLNFLVMGNGYVFGLIMNEKQKEDKIQEYLKNGIHNWSNQYQVKIHKNMESFLKDVENAREKEIPEKERENVEKYVFSLFV